ncbi:helix-turn-helix domain-containing protein [Bacillus gaemokensis]|uniref:helix-turn-helix domain-containing protein n=1 Tax=Bacillus gaemokensis TaxID=574375 RepID=UPI0009E51A8D|nr:helix-turn-helix domain-containing protein [Bacillus gaemokensis]
MLVNKDYEFRIYPNTSLEILIARTISCSYYIFNRFIDVWDHTYNETRMIYYSCCTKLTQFKQKMITRWLKEVDSIAL